MNEMMDCMNAILNNSVSLKGTLMTRKVTIKKTPKKCHCKHKYLRDHFYKFVFPPTLQQPLYN